MNNVENHLLVIFGASGDLTVKKLIPSLFNLFKLNLLPEKFAILGLGRTEFDTDYFRNKMKESLIKENNNIVLNVKIDDFLNLLHYQAFDTMDHAQYPKMCEKIHSLESVIHFGGNIIYYLSTPPSMYEIITKNLNTCKLTHCLSVSGWRRLIIEKPFGYDLSSAQNLNKKLLNQFQEEQIYRIDHYLGKETVQNILVTRFANGILEPLWNRNYIDYVEITSAENIGVEGRGGYYDNSGAMRDMIQNHLLQIVGLIAMESPVESDSNTIRNETLKVFQSIRHLNEQEYFTNVIRGQYTKSKIRGEDVLGYRDEIGVNPQSRTDTYVALKFFIENWRWSGVPFYIRSGKRLPTRVTEVVIHFKPAPHKIFNLEANTDNHNMLIIRIQPDEGLLFKIGMKVPGDGFNVKTVGMDFKYSDLSDVYLPTAYERLLMNCMQGDSTLYLRGDAVEATWKFITPILDAWKNNNKMKIYDYPAGTWGPTEADLLFANKNQSWRHPCANLSDECPYCEL